MQTLTTDNFCSVQCHLIDVVSGCGKNAEGAVQTEPGVSQPFTKPLTLAQPELSFCM